jgi:surface antigen
MRLSAIAGLFACGVIFAASSSTVNAQTENILKSNTPEQITQTENILQIIEPVEPQPAPANLSPIVHEVKAGETLSSLAELYETTWSRLFNKNTQLTTPDLINPGDKITIPTPDEVLQDRPMPAQQVDAVNVKKAQRGNGSTSSTIRTASRGSVAGNTYTPGYCTWYAKNRRPDLPNNLGNANTWVSRAAAQGIATGATPRVGAIGQQGMHVVYVESVNSDRTVTVSEMNYGGLYKISSRTVPASTFYYIY